jgi:hypothetical protein
LFRLGFCLIFWSCWLQNLQSCHSCK